MIELIKLYFPYCMYTAVGQLHGAICYTFMRTLKPSQVCQLERKVLLSCCSSGYHGLNKIKRPYTQIITRTYFPGGWIKPFPRWMEKWNKFPRWMDKWWKFPRWMVYWFKIKLAPWPSMLYQPISMTFYAISTNISDLLCWIN